MTPVICLLSFFEMYPSFEEAKKRLPIDFAKSKAYVGSIVLNITTFIVEVTKNGIDSRIVIDNGELKAVDELQQIYLRTEWDKQ